MMFKLKAIKFPLVGGGKLVGTNIQVPSDISSAAFSWWVLQLLKVQMLYLKR